MINAAYYRHGTPQRLRNHKPLSFEHALEGLVPSISTGTIFGIDVPTYSYLIGLFVFACNDAANLADSGFMRIEVTAALMASISATDRS